MSCSRTDFRRAPKGAPPTHCCPRARAVFFMLLLAGGVLTAPAAPAQAAAPYGVKAVAVASSKQGAPYAYGATGPKRFDCSGLTLYAFKKAGKRLPRTAAQQYAHTRHIRKADRTAGDLVFFPRGATMTHVGIYAGHDKIWHAPRPGTRVRLERIWSTAVRYGRAT